MVRGREVPKIAYARCGPKIRRASNDMYQAQALRIPHRKVVFFIIIIVRKVQPLSRLY